MMFVGECQVIKSGIIINIHKKIESILPFYKQANLLCPCIRVA